MDAFAAGGQAFNALLSRGYVLAIDDLGLPRVDALALVRSLRRQLRGLPILMVTARDAFEDRVASLDAGADDYRSSPSSCRNLRRGCERCCGASALTVKGQ